MAPRTSPGKSSFKLLTLRRQILREQKVLHFLATANPEEATKRLEKCSEAVLNIIGKIFYCLLNGFIEVPESLPRALQSQDSLAHFSASFKNWPDFSVLKKSEKFDTINKVSKCFPVLLGPLLK